MRVLDYRGVGTHTLYSTTANRRSPPSVARRGISAPSFLANFALNISIKHYLNLTTPANISADWALCLEDYFTHLTLEKGLSPNSIAAYQHDIELLRDYAESKSIAPTLVQQADIEMLIMQVGKDGALGPRSQVRLVSGLRGFFNYLLLEDRIENRPMEHIAPPRLGEHLPAVLSPAEVDAMEATIDLSDPLGHRNLAILEVLYSCGLRVTELVELRISQLYSAEGYLRVVGKGNKERLVPIGERALHDVKLYLGQRVHWPIKPAFADYLFLNQRGAKLTRIMVFYIIRESAAKAGIAKTVSPHTLRHSFATALVSGGADLRVVQAMLGHESIVTTELYTHLSQQHLRAAVMQYHPRGNR